MSFADDVISTLPQDQPSQPPQGSFSDDVQKGLQAQTPQPKPVLTPLPDQVTNTPAQQPQQPPTAGQTPGQIDAESYTNNPDILPGLGGAVATIPVTEQQIQQSPAYQKAQGEQTNLDTQTLGALKQQYPQNKALGSETSIPLSSEQPAPQGSSSFERASLGLADDFATKYQMFKKYYPQGEMREDKDKNLIFTNDANSGQWVRLSPTSQQLLMKLNDLGASDVSLVDRTKAALSLLSNAAQDNSNEALTTLALLLTKNPEALTMGPIARFATGAAMRGAGAKIAASEVSQGITGQTNIGNTYQAAKNGVKEGLETALLMAPIAIGNSMLNKIFGYVSGHGLFKLSDASKAAQVAWSKLQQLAIQQGVPEESVKAVDYMPQQLLDSPIFGKLINIAMSFSPDVEKYMTTQKQFLANILSKAVNEKSLGNAMNEAKLGDLLLRGKTLTDTVGGGAKAADDFSEFGTTTNRPIPTTSFFEAGNKGAEDLASYMNRSKPQVDAAYAQARSIEEPQFNYSHVINQAQLDELKLQKAGNIPDPDKKVLQGAIDQIKGWEVTPPTTETKFGRGTPTPENPAGEENQLVSLQTTPVDEIRRLQQELWEYAQPDINGRYRPGAAIAADLRNSLSNTLHNPINTTPEFSNAWSRANQLAAERFNNGEWTRVMQASKQEEGGVMSTPTSVAKGLTNPNQIDTLKRLQQVATPETVQAYKDAIKTNWLSDTNLPNLGKTLDKLPRDYLTEVFTTNGKFDAQEMQAYRQLSRDWNQIEKANVPGHLANNEAGPQQDKIEVASNFLQSLLRGEPASVVSRVNVLHKMIAQNPELGNSIRAGILQSLVRNSVRNVRGIAGAAHTPALANESFAQELLANKQSTIDSFLTPTDKDLLDNINVALTFTERRKDVGASLVGSEGVWGLLKGNLESFLKVAESKYISWSWTSGFGKRVLYGAGSSEAVAAREAQLMQGVVSGYYGKVDPKLAGAIKNLLILGWGASGGYNSYRTNADINAQTNANLKNGTQ